MGGLVKHMESKLSSDQAAVSLLTCLFAHESKHLLYCTLMVPHLWTANIWINQSRYENNLQINSHLIKDWERRLGFLRGRTSSV